MCNCAKGKKVFYLISALIRDGNKSGGFEYIIDEGNLTEAKRT